MSISFHTSVDVEIEGDEVYAFVLEEYKDDLISDLRSDLEEVLEDEVVQTASESVEYLKTLLTKIAGQTEDIFIRRALQTALGLLEMKQ